VDLPAGALVAALVIILVGAAIRGFTGFGASLIWVSGLTLLMDADEAIPIIFCLEVVASAHLVRAVRGEVLWSAVWRLMAGALLGLPLGAAVLLALDASTMQIVVSIAVLVSAVLLATGWQAHRSLGGAETLGVGLTSGILNGATGAGGPPVIVMFLGSPAGINAGRASMIAYFGLLDLVGVAIVAVTGLLDGTALVRFATLVPAMLIGASLGERGFGAVRPERVRQAAIATLGALALAGLVAQL
jgi:uncharacterized membrane protein YfcA